jgi:hypothetical protein
MTMATDTLKTLTSNSRFYILLSSFLISLLVISDLRLNFASDQLFYIRSEQVFGLLAMVYWYIALIISPLKSVIGTHSLRQATFARRAIGVSAAYFVLLHAVIATWGQLGGSRRVTIPSDDVQVVTDWWWNYCVRTAYYGRDVI